MSPNLAMYGLILLGIGYALWRVYRAGQTAQVAKDLTNVVQIKDKQAKVDSEPVSSPDDLLNSLSDDSK